MPFLCNHPRLKEVEVFLHHLDKVQLQCQSGKPVVTVIICTYHIKSEVYIYNETETSILKPIIRYLFESYDEVKYLTIKNKLKSNYKLTHQEVQFLVLSPFMVSFKFRLQKIKEVCTLIEEIKTKKLFDNDEMFLPLILAIKQYVSNEKEQENLIKVLTMDMSADKIYEKVMNSGILEQGIEIGMKKGREEGREEGRLNLAIELKNTLGIDKAIELSGFTRKELENETLTPK